VTVAGEVCGSIEKGMLVLLGVAAGDTEANARWLAEKVAGLRIFGEKMGISPICAKHPQGRSGKLDLSPFSRPFEDGQEKMYLSLSDVGGAMLVVSQFTLLGDCRRGRRPDFTAAAPPELAEKLYERFVEIVAAQGIPSPLAASVR
jgi:D-aminoacyl-tRNA deacylase